MTHIAMLLSNGFRPDPRVLKEAKGLAQRGHQVSIICWDRANEMPPTDTPYPGVEVIRIQSIPSSYGLGARQATRLVRFWLATLPILNRTKPDLVHCHDFDTLPAGLLWGKTHRRPVIYDAHEYYANLVQPRLKGKTGRLLYRFINRAESLGAQLSTAIITVDETLAAAYLKRNRKVVIIGHYPEQQLASHAAPVFTRPELRLVYVGRLSSDRGILTYVELLRRIRAAGIPARLILAGVFSPPSEQATFQASIAGMEGALDVLGWLSYEEIPSLLQSCDIGLCVLHPVERYIKALPVKLFEYMACGLPVIVSNFPAVAGIVDQAGCGALVDPTRAVEDAFQIVQAWWKYPEIARRLGENGRQAVLKEYNWESLLDRLDDLYRSITNR
jgi:glycosyltransferase involved in cell wall biosynthesis